LGAFVEAREITGVGSVIRVAPKGIAKRCSHLIEDTVVAYALHIEVTPVLQMTLRH